MFGTIIHQNLICPEPAASAPKNGSPFFLVPKLLLGNGYLILSYQNILIFNNSLFYTAPKLELGSQGKYYGTMIYGKNR